MAYPYGMKAAPAIGNGAPGLPRTPEVRGELLFTVPGLYRVQVPEGVTSMCAAVGSAAGGAAISITGGIIYCTTGGAGAVAWKNNIPVTPLDWIDVFVGRAALCAYNNSGTATAANGGDSYAVSATVCCAGGGKGASGSVAGVGGSVVAGDGGGAGGNGLSANAVSGSTDSIYLSGAGAGGYLGKGGNSVFAATEAGAVGNAGVGGAGGSGSAGVAGGGVSPFGLGADGAGGTGAAGASSTVGKGGSGGEDGSLPTSGLVGSVGLPGRYGSGPVVRRISSATVSEAAGADGFARLIWGPGRSFPSTDVGQG